MLLPGITSFGDGIGLGHGSFAISTVRLPLTVVASAAAQDTGWDLPANSVVLDAFVKVAVAEATGTGKTINLGLAAGESGGDADGFIAGLSVASTGIKIPRATVTAGVLASNTRGALLADYVVGTDSDDRGIYVPKYHIGNGTAKSVVYALSDVDFVELVADAFIVYATLVDRTQ